MMKYRLVRSIGAISILPLLLSCTSGTNTSRTPQISPIDTTLTLQTLSGSAFFMELNAVSALLSPSIALLALQDGRWDGFKPYSEPTTAGSTCENQAFSTDGQFGLSVSQTILNCQSLDSTGQEQQVANGFRFAQWLGRDNSFSIYSTGTEIAEFSSGATAILKSQAVWEVRYDAATSGSVAQYQFDVENTDTERGRIRYFGTLNFETNGDERFTANGSWTFVLNNEIAEGKLKNIVYDYSGTPTGCPTLTTTATELADSPPIMPIDGKFSIDLPNDPIELEYILCSARETRNGGLYTYDGRDFEDQQNYGIRYQTLFPGFLVHRISYLTPTHLALPQRRWCNDNDECLRFNFINQSDTLLSSGGYQINDQASGSLSDVTQPGDYTMIFDQLSMAATSTVPTGTLNFEAALAGTTLTMLNASKAITLVALPLHAP